MRPTDKKTKARIYHFSINCYSAASHMLTQQYVDITQYVDTFLALWKSNISDGWRISEIFHAKKIQQNILACYISIKSWGEILGDLGFANFRISILLFYKKSAFLPLSNILFSVFAWHFCKFVFSGSFFKNQSLTFL